jgi:hypothetical protein
VLPAGHDGKLGSSIGLALPTSVTCSLVGVHRVHPKLSVFDPFNARYESMLRYFLLRDWSNSANDFGSLVFAIGKGIGIVGRCLGMLLIGAVVFGLLISSSVLLIAGYAVGFAAFAFLAVEGIARVVMLLGNEISRRVMSRSK